MVNGAGSHGLHLSTEETELHTAQTDGKHKGDVAHNTRSQQAEQANASFTLVLNVHFKRNRVYIFTGTVEHIPDIFITY